MESETKAMNHPVMDFQFELSLYDTYCNRIVKNVAHFFNVLE